MRSVVSASTAVAVRNPRTDPPNVKFDRPWRRLVRVAIGETAIGLGVQRIARAEAAYYGVESNSTTNPGGRWQSCKVLAATFYGKEGTNAFNVTTGPTGLVAPTTYTDVGDLNHRPCIKIIYPPTMPTEITATTTTNFVAFTPGSVDFADVYVEFA